MQRRLDFSVIVGDILQRGFTQREIARRVGVSVATVNNWRNGHASPRYEAGDRLMFLSVTLNEPGASAQASQTTPA